MDIGAQRNFSGGGGRGGKTFKGTQNLFKVLKMSLKVTESMKRLDQNYYVAPPSSPATHPLVSLNPYGKYISRYAHIFM